MRNRFDKQLQELNAELTTMGALCEEAISIAVKYLVNNDKNLKAKVLDTERQINQKEREIEGLCMKLLLQQQPVATDLRMISSALKMISDMERIGDQASDISEMACFVATWISGRSTHIEDMARAAIKMVTDSVDSFINQDLQIAYGVIRQDDLMDKLFLKVKTELIHSIQSGSDDAEALVDLLMIAKYFERIGDHAENIAEWVIYSISGEHKNIE